METNTQIYMTLEDGLHRLVVDGSIVLLRELLHQGLGTSRIDTQSQTAGLVHGATPYQTKNDAGYILQDTGIAH